MRKQFILSIVFILFLVCWVAPYSGGAGTVNSMTDTVVDAGPVSVGNSSSYPVHNLNTSEQFSSIQAAIDAPNTTGGHLIEVDPGNYTENIVVNESVTIRSSTGDPSGTVIQAANASNDVVTVTADRVTISGFTILNATAAGRAGIFLASSDNRVENNIVTGNYNGIIALNEIAAGVQASSAQSLQSETPFERYSAASARAANSDDDARTRLPEPPKPSALRRPSRKASSSGYVGPLALDMVYGAGDSPPASSHRNVIRANDVSLNEYIGIVLSGSSDNIVQDNWLDANGDTGIYLESGNRNLVRNNTATSNYWGIYLYVGDNNTLSGNALDSNIDEGISIGDATNTWITNNTATYQHGYGGISLWGISSNTTVTDNIVSFNEGSGIILWDANDNNTIAHNDAQYNYYSGIDVMGTSSRNKIEDNIATGNEGSGISLWEWTSSNYLNNNILSNSSYNGIDLMEFTNNNTITNNTASYNIFSGIGLFDSGSDNTVSQNELSGNRFGLSIEGDAYNNTITNNAITRNQFQGIWLLDMKYFNSIAHNIVSNNTYFGIGASRSSNLSINSNVVTGNEQGIGLLLSENITVTDNIANENKLSGIYIWASENNTFSNNSLSSNIFDGFYLLEASYNTITNNFVSGSYFGAALLDAQNNTIANNDAESCYYTEVWLYYSPDNVIMNDTYYIQEDIFYGVSVSILESSTPSWQAVTNETTATYSIRVKNLGNSIIPDEFTLNVSSPEYFLDTSSVTLGPRDWEDVTLSVGDSEPGIYRVTVEASSISDPTVKDSVETWTIVRGIVGPEPAVTNTITDSAIINCSADGLTSSISDSVIDRSAIINTTITDSTITNSVITNSMVVDTILPPEVTLTNAMVHAGIISEGTITIGGVTYSIDYDQRLEDILIGSDYRDSNLVGLTGARTLYVAAADSDVNFDISAKHDYSAGSLRVQRAILPPAGVLELTNSIGGYVWANVSENVANSTEWVMITVFYDPDELGELNESSLTLQYFNETVGSSGWEEVPVGGVNLTGQYVWANISHYSVFSVSGSVTPKKDTPSDSGTSGGGTKSRDSDGDGLPDWMELLMGTDPANKDTDGDGYTDDRDPFPLDPTLPLQPTPTVTTRPRPTPAVVLTPPVSPPPASPVPTAAEAGWDFEFPIPGYEALAALGCFMIVTYIARRRRQRRRR
ncbi:MAG: right-handed parallel beta-helix repeat-containing protein [Methanomicrobia archaeon]|nr:right-handed parallel beta-helix repeat-containing protein [Methanomicrobia archaeon]